MPQPANPSSIALPQKVSDPDERKLRVLQLELARTAYNYMRTYPNLEAIPLCAGLPTGEDFTPEYNAILAKVETDIAENFLTNTLRIVSEEISDDAKVDKLLSTSNLTNDIRALLTGLPELVQEFQTEGPTAFLRSTLFDLLRQPGPNDKDYLAATSKQAYADLIATLPTPLSLTLPPQPWMEGPDEPCEQDWYFGYLQVAGFNTANLRGVVNKRKNLNDSTVPWNELEAKIPFTDDMFQKAVGPTCKETFAAAVSAGRVFVCDYADLLGGPEGTVDGKESDLHGKHRYLCAPIALFYWNETPPPNYPRNYAPEVPGVLQPIAIQLFQKFDEDDVPIFMPVDSEGANDPLLVKWRVAKHLVNMACSIQHESVAHLNDCHLIIESIAVATHRQLATTHPIFKLLAPHLRFTLRINNGALNNLIVPGGVVATNIGPDIHWTLTMVNNGRKAYRWNAHNPDNLFAARGVNTDRLPVFPLRDDTMPIWQAIKDFVGKYLAFYYDDQLSNRKLLEDTELQAWVRELIAEDRANIQGIEGLENGQVTSNDALTAILAQIIYIAGPQHSGVGNAQYPLASYMPGVAASSYAAPPTKAPLMMPLGKVNPLLPWYPPLDVALYTISFVYLLSGVQFDRLGHYTSNPQLPYFSEQTLQYALEDFQSQLASIETTINQRNRGRPMPFTFQLPSRIANSISI